MRTLAAISSPGRSRSGRPVAALHEGIADAVLSELQAAARPVILAGPHLSSRQGRALLAELEQATRVPAVVLESPRGVADATIGAFSDIMRRADLVVLLGKALDFTVRWLEPPVADKAARVIVLDPDGALVARAVREKGERLLIGAVADSMLAARTLIARARLARASPPRLARRSAGGHGRPAACLGPAGLDDARQAAPDRGVSRAGSRRRPRPRDHPHLRRRRVRAVGANAC